MADVPSTNGDCTDCGTPVPFAEAGTRCPACFDRYLYSLDAGFLDSFREFGCRSPQVLAEACLRSLVLAAPEHRKLLATAIFQQYVEAIKDLAGLFMALRNRGQAPVMKSFMELRLDASNLLAFHSTVQAATDLQLCAALDLPTPVDVASACPHLSEGDAYQVAVAIYHLVKDLKKATDKGGPAAEALARLISQMPGAIMAENVRWLNDSGRTLTPDQVAMLVLDPARQSIVVEGISADEEAMGRVVDAIETVTRASSNLIFAYLQTNNL